jgi:lipopolysaccharide/colanic/teichoic acid biosynthesis glycosyltransferase
MGAVVAIWVRLVSPGPVLFRQERVGHMGARFFCLKFRTMKVSADSAVHREYINQLMASNRPMEKLDVRGDSRLIPGGVWLRAMGLDELPQIVNVLRGEMSLVGPRPATVYEHSLYEASHRRRCATPPGLTGLWQVSGKNRTTFERMMELDLAYVAAKSPLLDAKISAGTVPAILLQLWDVQGRRRKAGKAGREGEPRSAPARTATRGKVPDRGVRDLTLRAAAPAARQAGVPDGPVPGD